MNFSHSLHETRMSAYFSQYSKSVKKYNNIKKFEKKYVELELEYCKSGFGSRGWLLCIRLWNITFPNGLGTFLLWLERELKLSDRLQIGNTPTLWETENTWLKHIYIYIHTQNLGSEQEFGQLPIRVVLLITNPALNLIFICSCIVI